MDANPSPSNSERPEYFSIEQPLEPGVQVQLLKDYSGFKRGDILTVLSSHDPYGTFTRDELQVRPPGFKENKEKNDPWSEQYDPGQRVGVPRHLVQVIQQRLSEWSALERAELKVGTPVRLLRDHGEWKAGMFGIVSPPYPDLDIDLRDDKIPVHFKRSDRKKITGIPYDKLAIVHIDDKI